MVQNMVIGPNVISPDTKYSSFKLLLVIIHLAQYTRAHFGI